MDSSWLFPGSVITFASVCSPSSMILYLSGENDILTASTWSSELSSPTLGGGKQIRWVIELPGESDICPPDTVDFVTFGKQIRLRVCDSLIEWSLLFPRVFLRISFTHPISQLERMSSINWQEILFRFWSLHLASLPMVFFVFLFSLPSTNCSSAIETIWEILPLNPQVQKGVPILSNDRVFVRHSLTGLLLSDCSYFWSL
jgi:hypothetical protein